MVLGLFGLLVDPTDQFYSEGHRQFSKCFVWVITVIVGGVTPMAFILLPLLLLGWLLSLFQSPSTQIGMTVLAVWCVIEVCFYFYCLTLREKFKPPRAFTGLSTFERQYFLQRYLEQCADPWTALVRWFPWDDPEDVGRECLEEWFCWAYFSKPCKELTKSEEEELLVMTTAVIRKCPRLGKPSGKPEMTFMQLHFDDIVVQHKPFVAVAVISIMQIGGHLSLLWLGFESHALSGDTTLSYWSYRPKSASTKRPIFIVHGIGIGITMYLSVIKAVVQSDPDRPVYILELPHISLKIVNQVPDMEATLEAVDEIFTRHDLKDCSFLAHSYGTIVTAWILKERPKYVSKLSLVDPVCFALWDPDLIFNFLYRKPPGPIHRLCQFFVAQDLLVAFTLFRNFWWVQNILLPQDINVPAKIYLSSHDFIIDCGRANSYLEMNQKIHPAEMERFDIVTMQGLSHGSFLNSPKYLKEIASHL